MPLPKTVKKTDPAIRALVDKMLTDDVPVEIDARIGKRVLHEVFGKGTVEAIIGAGETSKIRITFDAACVKTLLQSLASSKMTML